MVRIVVSHYIIYNCINGDIDLAFYSELLSSFVICNKGNRVGVTCGGCTENKKTQRKEKK
jgi:hypothetical protein